MPRITTPSESDLDQLDRYYREGGLRAMASPHVHYDEPHCPHDGCGHVMEWIDFQLELFNDPEGIYKPLVRSWWEGTGFIGRCPRCAGWVRFTTRRMQAIPEEDSGRFPRLPDGWHTVAQFA
ncbi:MAG: hypothetical protein P4L84_06345 [Isosphaeraceae bacterium]|nr:hypothetical protein [Isosphaeraceae bacterium]